MMRSLPCSSDSGNRAIDCQDGSFLLAKPVVRDSSAGPPRLRTSPSDFRSLHHFWQLIFALFVIAEITIADSLEQKQKKLSMILSGGSFALLKLSPVSICQLKLSVRQS